MSELSNTLTAAETTVEATFEKTVDAVVGHFRDLIGFAGQQRDRINTVASDVASLTQKVETDVLAQLGTFKDDITASIMGQVTAKVQAVVDDLGAQIAALTAGTTTPASPAAPATPVAGTVDPAQANTIAAATGSTTDQVTAAIQAHSDATSADTVASDVVPAVAAAAAQAGADPATASSVAQAVVAAAGAPAVAAALAAGVTILADGTRIGG